MNYQIIEKDNMLNGVGLRLVLWVSGCDHHCKECHNPETWDENSGQLFDENVKNEILEYLKNGYVDGITLSGGDPLYPKNRDILTALCKEIKEKYPNKSIWCYTGFDFEQVKDLSIMNYIDILVDGEFKIDLKDTKLHWRGSSNQRIINIPETLKSNNIVLFKE